MEIADRPQSAGPIGRGARYRRGAGRMPVYVLLAAANVASWLWAWHLFAGRPTLLGAATLAYLLGLRHAFDADHIAAIDNVVRKLIFDRKPPHLAGFFFALGHSIVVILVCLCMALAATRIQSHFAAAAAVGGVLAAGASGLLLSAVGVMNIPILWRLWREYRSNANHQSNGDKGETQAIPATGGIFVRLLPRLFNRAGSAWHMFPVGVVLALSFDTATQVSLLALSTSHVAPTGESLRTLMVFPALFAAGMCFMDTADTALITRAYTWALRSPQRRLGYNLAITSLSVAAAFVIGACQFAALLAGWFGPAVGQWNLAHEFDSINANAGFALTALLFAIWIGSRILYRRRRLSGLR